MRFGSLVAVGDAVAVGGTEVAVALGGMAVVVGAIAVAVALGTTVGTVVAVAGTTVGVALGGATVGVALGGAMEGVAVGRTKVGVSLGAGDPVATAAKRCSSSSPHPVSDRVSAAITAAKLRSARFGMFPLWCEPKALTGAVLATFAGKLKAARHDRSVSRSSANVSTRA